MPRTTKILLVARKPGSSLVTAGCLHWDSSLRESLEDLIINYRIFNMSPYSSKEQPNDITPKGLIYSKPLFLRGKAI